MSDDDDPTPPPALRDLGERAPSRKVLKSQMWKRMNVQNEHFMGCIVGREGWGKSHSAMTVAKAVDPSFTADDVFFQPKHLLEAFDSDAYDEGNVVVLDEAGVGLGSRSWYEKDQILLNQTLQTVRDDNMGVLFTLPRLSELDSQTRGRLHAFVQIVDINRDEFAIAKWKRVKPLRDERSDILYPPKPSLRTTRRTTTTSTRRTRSPTRSSTAVSAMSYRSTPATARSTWTRTSSASSTT